ncbi:MAG: hypothetical protein M1820_010044 [Bogoriella megaspora]|nr:MAG: hypothetical protein M1820_010044 [Bogoriella megaspora]
MDVKKAVLTFTFGRRWAGKQREKTLNEYDVTDADIHEVEDAFNGHVRCHGARGEAIRAAGDKLYNMGVNNRNVLKRKTAQVMCMIETICIELGYSSEIDKAIIAFFQDDAGNLYTESLLKHGDGSSAFKVVAQFMEETFPQRQYIELEPPVCLPSLDSGASGSPSKDTTFKIQKAGLIGLHKEAQSEPVRNVFAENEEAPTSGRKASILTDPALGILESVTKSTSTKTTDTAIGGMPLTEEPLEDDMGLSAGTEERKRPIAHNDGEVMSPFPMIQGGKDKRGHSESEAFGSSKTSWLSSITLPKVRTWDISHSIQRDARGEGSAWLGSRTMEAMKDYMKGVKQAPGDDSIEGLERIVDGYW